jgi:hypothetical protein
MTRQDNVEETIREKLGFAAGARLRERMLRRVLDAREVSRQAGANSGRMMKWRRMMRSPILKMTPAAVIVVVGACIAFWQGPSTPAYAIEQTVEAMKGVRFVHVIERSGVGGAIQGERWIEVGEDGRQVRYRQDRPPHVLVIDDGESTARFHDDTKTVYLYDCGAMPYQWIGPLRETFDNLRQEGLIIEENAVRRGRRVHKVWWPMMRRICYVDPGTKLPVEIGGTELSYDEPGAQTFDVDMSRYAHTYAIKDRRSGSGSAVKAGGGAAEREDLLYADMELILDPNISVETVSGDNIIPLYQTGPRSYAGEVDLKVTCDRETTGRVTPMNMTGTVPAASACWITGSRPSAPGGVATVGVRLRSVPRIAPRVGHVGTVTVRFTPSPEPMNDVDACDILAFALYDAKRYEEALAVFESMEGATNASDDERAIAVVWQGHMLDLLGRREEAIERYRKAASLGLETVKYHNHYDLPYDFTAYTTERMKSPFVRPESGSER